MQLVLTLAIAALILGVVAWPLMAGRRSRVAGPASWESDSPEMPSHSHLNDVYEAIRTLQVEYQLGRVGDADYRRQLDEYRKRAATILRDLDRQGGLGRDD